MITVGKPNERKEVCKEEWEGLGTKVARHGAALGTQGSGGAGIQAGNYCTSSQSRAGPERCRFSLSRIAV